MMRVEISLKEHCLHVSAVGDFSVSAMNAMATTAIAALIQHSSSKCLFDLRQVTGLWTLVERFVWVESVAGELSKMPLVSRPMRFAFVGPESILDSRRFGETVAINRGINVKVTNCMEEALRWLEVDIE